MNANRDLIELTAVEATARLRRGELRAEDYAAALLARHRACRLLGTTTWIDEARVLSEARDVDKRLARNESPGRLAGLPVIIKDNIDVAGSPTAAAHETFRDNRRASTAPVAESLFRAGAVFFARANMQELAGGGTCSNPSFGFVRNPYDPSRIPGGSSGGTAAAIAARIVPAGLGSDTAGSVRIPSAMCGIAGLRPTILGRKLYSDAGILPLALDLDTIGPMGRTVEDVALLHSVITETPMAGAADLRRVRIGVPRSPYWEDLDPEVASLSESALEKLRDAGATLVDVNVNGYYELASEVYMTLVMHGLKEDLGPYLKEIGSKLSVADIVGRIASRDTRSLFEMALGMSFTDTQIERARTAQRREISKHYAALFAAHRLDAIAFPPEPIAALPINEGGDRFDDEIVLNGRKVNSNFLLIRNTRVTGALGAPGLSVPSGLTRGGLPVAMELDGLPNRDSELLSLGCAAETVWGRLPPPRQPASGPLRMT